MAASPGQGSRDHHGAPAPRPGDPPVTPELVREHGLSEEEWARILEAVGRDLTYTELGLFSALWSEHCGYKNSKPLLRTLPTEAPWVLQGPGENAGVIDIGDDVAVAFKIESHNHPSAIEPYEGAATGVGGILRDVFTMGARPIAVLDSLRFGALDNARVRYLFAGVVKGIGDYGNCVGIPNIGGETFFDEAYEGNPLVNAMAIGVMKRDELIRGEASGPGNPIISVGARTGRDGIHGATFASEELGEGSEAKRPQVQVGDPFTEKLLLEASLELIRSGHIVGIQDMGAAGLASSSTEMAARSGTGVDIDVALMPVREPGMTPYEILLSESQERMLVVARAGHEDHVRAILEKWELEAAVIGQVTDDGLYRVRENGVVVCELPGDPLVNGCPTYVRDAAEAADVARLRAVDVAGLVRAGAPGPDEALLRLMASPNIASKAWVHDQYDTTVRTNTVVPPGGDAGVLRIRGTRKGIAATVDCNGRYCYLDPRAGAMAAVAEAARNLVCVGARPRAVTDNLNFGNPLKPEVYHQMKEAVAGIGEACRAFHTPVVSGNVSLYNENPGGAIYPTPVIGMVGVLDDVARHLTSRFQPGDAIVLLGDAIAPPGDAIALPGDGEDPPTGGADSQAGSRAGGLGGSEYLSVLFGRVAGAPPAVDLAAEAALQAAMLEIAADGLAHAAHDCAEGGLAVALAECAVANPAEPLGLDVRLDGMVSLPGERPHEPAPSDDTAVEVAALLFGEAQGRIVASCPPASLSAVLEVAGRHGVAARHIGEVGDAATDFHVRRDGATLIRQPVATLADAYHNAIPRIMDGQAGAVSVDVEHPAVPR